jgi:hypothetical protein
MKEVTPHMTTDPSNLCPFVHFQSILSSRLIFQANLTAGYNVLTTQNKIIKILAGVNIQ